MVDKIESIRQYVTSKFPEGQVDDLADVETIGHSFRVITKEHVLLLTVSRAILDDHAWDVIKKILEKEQVAELMKQFPEKTVLLRPEGHKIVPRKE